MDSSPGVHPLDTELPPHWTISRDLIRDFGSMLPVEVIERCVASVAARFEGARIDTFLPVLVHKAARRELERLGGPSRGRATDNS